MLHRSLRLLKAPRFKGGLSKKDYYRKLSKPGTSKPWKNANVLTSGELDMSPTYSVIGEDNRIDLGNLAKAAPLGVTQDFDRELSRRAQLRETAENITRGSPFQSAEGQIMKGKEKEKTIVHSQIPTTQTDFSHHSKDESQEPWHAPAQGGQQQDLLATREGPSKGQLFNLSASASDTQLETDADPVITKIPFGNHLSLNVHKVTNYGDEDEGADANLSGGKGGIHEVAPLTAGGAPIPLSLQKFRRTPLERRDSLRLPRHLNQLFTKLMGWTAEAVEIDKSAKLVVPPRSGEEDAATGSTTNAALRARAEYKKTRLQHKYGLLMDRFENDKFAIENRIKAVGKKFEAQYLDWDGVHVIDSSAGEMAYQRSSKTALVMHTSPDFKVPIMNHDNCAGCGATLQDKDSNAFGFVGTLQVERYIEKHQAALQSRVNYADRMAELQAHWEKHGRRVGEEWLDFMTDDEFKSIYHYKARHFICSRCALLEKAASSEARRKLLPAPDFTEQLKALKEKSCVVVLVVDITDFPGSMVYELPSLISMNNPVIIAVNKMDCVRLRRYSYTGPNMRIVKRSISERHVIGWVGAIASQFGLPKHLVKAIVPISAKRGWGIDGLIQQIEIHTNLTLRYAYPPKPAYFVGVANVGKSSVINAISHALSADEPPTPQSKKVYAKIIDRNTGKERIFFKWYTPPHAHRDEMNMMKAHRNKHQSRLLTVSSLPGTTVAVNGVQLGFGGDASKKIFLYDTPGLFPHWHQSSPLNIYHRRQCLIRAFRNPDCYVLLPGTTFFFSGAVALDVVKGNKDGVLFMVYSSHKIRTAMVATATANEFWAEELGRALYPPGCSSDVGDERLTESRTYLFECFQRHKKYPKADIYVCGLGWIAFCAGSPCDLVIRVRTLPGIVHGVREPLRYKDLRGFTTWPSMRRSASSRASPPSMDRVVRLVNKEVDPTAPPLELVRPTRDVRSAPGAESPFDDVVSALQTQGKLG